MLPIMCLLMGAGTIQVSRSVLAGIVTAAATAYSTTYNRVLNQLQYGSVGKLRAGLAQIVQNAIRDNDFYTFWLPEVQQVVGRIEAKALAAQTAAQAATRLSRASQMFLNVFAPIFAVGAILETFDLGAVLIDFAGSDMADSWAAVVIRQKLNLAPQAPRIAPGDRQTFTVANPANTPGTTFEYDWTQTSSFATLSANGEVNVGNRITTTKRSVDLVTTGSDVTPITILVIGYDTSVTPRQEIGRAGTVVSFLYPAQILPSSPPLMDRGDQRLYSVVVSGTLPNGVLYKWTLTGTSGSIGSTNVVTTSVPQINYTAGAGRGGTDRLHVDVLDGAGTLYAKADANIVVAGPGSIQFDVAGAWDPTQTPPNGHYAFSDGVGTRVLDGANSGLDGLVFGYDAGAGEQFDSGFLMIMYVTAGAVITQGETFSKLVSGASVANGKFDMLLASDPSNPNSSQYDPAGTGTCTINVLGQFSTGVHYAQYSFSIINGAGGTIVGSGIGRWP